MDKPTPLLPLQPIKTPLHTPSQGFLTDRPVKRQTKRSAFLRSIERMQHRARLERIAAMEKLAAEFNDKVVYIEEYQADEILRRRPS